MPRGLTFIRPWLLVVLTAMLVAGCGSPPSAAPAGRMVGTINVYATTSLTEIVTTLATMFEATHPGVAVRPSFGPDTTLVGDAATAPGTPIVITQGPPDVPAFATGTAVVPVASNQIVIAVALGDPKGISDVATLTAAGLRVALCVETEPCGAASTAVLKDAGVALPAAIRVPDTRSARAQVEQGTADAALVYRTDTRAAATSVDTVEFPQSQAAMVRYQAAAPGGRGDPASAKIFLDFLASAVAQDSLSNAGFQPPSG